MNNKNKFLDENDIRPRNLMEKQNKAMQIDIEWLNKKSNNFVDVCCPACGSKNKKFLYFKFNLSHVRCQSCFTQYVNPRPTEAILKDFYKNSVNYAYWAKYIFSASADVRKKKIFVPRVNTLMKKIKNKNLKGTLLEIGAAYGYFCEEIKKLNHFSKIIGIEPTPDLASVLRKKNIDVIESSYEDVILNSGIDVIVNFEVIEHLFSPEKFLNWCFSKLNPGGCLYLTCPNIAGFETTILAEKAGTVDHEHLNLFNPSSLKGLVKKIEFEKIIVKTPGVLDFDVVKQAYLSKKIENKHLGTFLLNLINLEDKAVENKFQKFLIKTNHSSHMMLMAFKPSANN